MKNFYDGVATLDAKGEATVTLPAWFEALNQFRNPSCHTPSGRLVSISPPP
jgi:hypothetical protein